MKKSVIYSLLFAALLVSIGATAQPSSGIKAGLNMSFMKDNAQFEMSPSWGYQVGYTLGIKITQNFSVSIDAVWMKRSLHLHSTEVVDSLLAFNGTKNGNYISIPLAINYNIKKWYIFAGYEYSYKIPIFGLGHLNANENDDQAFIGMGYNFKHFDVALKFGTSLNDERMGPKSYIIDAPTAIVERQSSKMSTFQLGITYHIGKSKK